MPQAGGEILEGWDRKKPCWNPALTAKLWGCLFSALVWQREESSGSWQGLRGVGKSLLTGNVMQKEQGLKNPQQAGDWIGPALPRNTSYHCPASVSPSTDLWEDGLLLLFPPHLISGKHCAFSYCPSPQPWQPGCSSAALPKCALASHKNTA